MTPKTELPKYTPHAEVPIAAQLQPAVLVPHVRPIRTYYYDYADSKPSEWSRRSRASTLHNAIRAAVMHVLQKTAGKAEFFDEDGVRIGWVKRIGPRRLEIFHTDFKLH